MNYPATMTAVRLHGPRDLRVEQLPHPGQPGPGEALLSVTAVGICGSDLHSYKEGAVGSNVMKKPFILGHEFAAVVEAVGPEAIGGNFKPLQPGMRVAVEPAQPCWACEMCEQGHPNLCYNMHFCGAYPDNGSLCQWIRMPARSCFPLSDGINDETGALLEPLGVAIHTMGLAKIQVGDSVAILGAGGIGLGILKLAKLAGANPVFVTDKFAWRLDLARKMGAVAFNCDDGNPVRAVLEATNDQGVDVAIEAAWSDHSIQQSAAMARVGGRLVIVGISDDDKLVFNHSTVRRKGLTIKLARRMKHTYPRAIELVERGAVILSDMISHRFPLEQTPEAFALNAEYADQVVKVIIDVSSQDRS